MNRKSQEDAKVVKLRVSARTLRPRIREAAQDSSNVTFIPDIGKDSLGGRLNFMQALSCLREGEIVGKPALDEHGNWVFRVERFSANAFVTLKVVAKCDGARVERLFVLRDEE